MRYLSLFSGIEAASVAWRPIGWEAAGFAEVEPFASAVLKHHYPHVSNFGDVNNFRDWPDFAVDVVCGGSPCQSYSGAGLRAGLDDPRGQLMLVFGHIVARYRPRFVVFENVPGLLSSGGGRDFASFLGLLSGQRIEPPKDVWRNSGVVAGYRNAYGLAWRVLDAQYIRVDGYARAVPQRRQRVFVVGCLGDWRSAAAVLLERESLRGDPAPRREAGARVAGSIGCGSPASGGRIGADEAAANQLVADTLRQHPRPGSTTPGAIAFAYGGNNTSGPRDVASTLSAHGGTGRHDFESETFIAFDTTQVTSAANYSTPKPGGPCHPLAAHGHAPAIAFNARQDPINGQINGPLDTDGTTSAVAQGMRVRRLMPVKAERLQGFPDGYTAITYRGRPAKDGPRYRVIGNSWAVNCARWIGQRIAMVDTLRSPTIDQHGRRIARPARLFGAPV